MNKNATKINKKPFKPRNLIAVAAFLRNGSGVHKDRKKEANKNACRGKIGG